MLAMVRVSLFGVLLSFFALSAFILVVPWSPVCWGPFALLLQVLVAFISAIFCPQRQLHPHCWWMQRGLVPLVPMGSYVHVEMVGGVQLVTVGGFRLGTIFGA